MLKRQLDSQQIDDASLVDFESDRDALVPHGSENLSPIDVAIANLESRHELSNLSAEYPDSSVRRAAERIGFSL